MNIPKEKAGIVIGYEISLIFKTQNGSDYSCYGSVPKKIIDKLQGDPLIKIKYLQSDPEKCEIEGEEHESSWLYLFVGW